MKPGIFKYSRGVSERLLHMIQTSLKITKQIISNLHSIFQGTQ